MLPKWAFQLNRIKKKKYKIVDHEVQIAFVVWGKLDSKSLK